MYRHFLPTLALAALALLGVAPAQAQTAPAANTWRACDFDAQQARYFATHPGEAARYDAMLRDLSSPAALQRGGAATAGAAPDITVPVVVHILYANIPASNQLPTSAIRDRQVNDFIDRVNLDFSKTNADTASVLPVFVPLIANVGFKFRLARLDPNGQPTTGITRHFSIETNYGTAAATSVVYWNPNRYLNVWVVEGIASGAGGYTFGQLCPGGGGNDGIVVRAAQFGPNAFCTGNLCARTMTHEIGHYFGLPHTWGRSNTPGLPGNCRIDDNIADTPNTAGYNNAGGNCNKAYAPCTDPATGRNILSNVENYMDYADCERMFTLGQRAVMRGLLTDPRFACRATLVSAANLVATGTNDGYVPRTPTPIANFHPARTEVCQNTPVQLRADYYTYNTNATGGAVTYTWSFPGGTPATATGPTTSVSYAAPGYYDVTMTASNSAGTDSETRSQLIKVSGPAAGITGPINESFEAPNFFGSNPPPSLRGYTTSGTTTTGVSNLPGYPSAQAAFQQAQSQPNGDVAADGNAFLLTRGLSNAANSVSVLTTPNIDIAPLGAAPFVQFRRFFSRRLAGNGGTESLNVAYSTDCGATYTTLSNLTAAQLYTTTAVVAGNGPETVSDWQPLRLQLPASLQGARSLQLRFTFSNGALQGNSFYLDALSLSSPSVSLAARATFAERGIGLYPNPLTNETALHLGLTSTTQVAVRLTDVLGRQLLATPARAYAAGEQTVALPTGAAALPAGLYVVHVSLDGRTFSSKLTVR